MSDRDTYKYDFRIGRKIVHTGITNDLGRREKEHKAEHKAEHQAEHDKGKITQVGRVVTRKSALEWEDAQRKKGKPTGP